MKQLPFFRSQPAWFTGRSDSEDHQAGKWWAV
jgi:hypothetical protein